MAYARLVGAYTRLEFEPPPVDVPPPALVVANHGFGGLFDLHLFALAEGFRRLGFGPSEPAVFLTHQLLWSLGLGPYMESAGFLPASRESALAGFDAGRYVIVFPGGDYDAAKTWPHRHHVHFHGREGFARLAIDAGVTIVPIVMVGGGESLVCLSEGRRIARALRFDKLVREETVPVTLSIPWGLTIGWAALVPYIPLPTKVKVAYCDPVTPRSGEDPAGLSARVQEAMSAKAAALTPAAPNAASALPPRVPAGRATMKTAPPPNNAS